MDHHCNNNNNDTLILNDLKTSLPGRSQQIQQIYNLFKDQPYPNCLFINGNTSCGKTTVLTTILNKLSINYCYINMIECYTTKILLETILQKLFKIFRKCDNMMDFVDFFNEVNEYVDNTTSIIIIDKAEKLRTMDSNLFPCLTTINELIDHVPLTTVFLSELPVQKFYPKFGITEIIRVQFPQYNKEELLEILLLDYNYLRYECVKNVDFTLDFYRNYLNIVLSVFYRICRDLCELRYLSRKYFIKYCQPIVQNQIRIDDSMALWRRISPILKQASQTLYLRIDNDNDDDDDNSTNDNREKFDIKHLELPFYAKYLLIAAYLASYNPVKDDKRLFLKYHGKKVKTQRDIKKKSKINELLTTQIGPKLFSFDRLLAIFYAILDNNKIGFNNNLLIQVSSLVELQLLTCISDCNSLDSPKYKCNVNFDFIQIIAKMIGFNIRKYLSDFSHL